jgi:chromosome segregation ATPase
MTPIDKARKTLFHHCHRKIPSLKPQPELHMNPTRPLSRPCSRRTLFSGLLATGLVVASFGAAPLTAADADLETTLKATLKARQHHAETLLSSLRATDKRVESRMENLVKALTAVADTKDSKTKVARLKQDTIEGLKKNIDLYNRKRAEIQEQILRPTTKLFPEQKEQIRKALDSRIEKRIAQIVELEKSLPSHEDYKKYQVIGGGVGFADTTLLKNEDWEQNRRVTQHTDAVRKDLIKELRKSIDRLGQQDRRLRKQAQGQTAAADWLETEIKRNADLLAARQGQLEQVLAEPATPARAIGKGEADALDEAVKLAVTGLRIEITQLFAEYAAYLTFLPSVNEVQYELDQRRSKGGATSP